MKRKRGIIILIVIATVLIVNRNTKADFTFGTPIPVPNLSSQYDECTPSISADGLELFFCGWRNNRPGGHGEADIWVTTRKTSCRNRRSAGAAIHLRWG